MKSNEKQQTARAPMAAGDKSKQDEAQNALHTGNEKTRRNLKECQEMSGIVMNARQRRAVARADIRATPVAP